MILSIGRLYSFLELSLIILNKPLEYLISGDNLNKGKNKSAPKPISKESQMPSIQEYLFQLHLYFLLQSLTWFYTSNNKHSTIFPSLGFILYKYWTL